MHRVRRHRGGLPPAAKHVGQVLPVRGRDAPLLRLHIHRQHGREQRVRRRCRGGGGPGGQDHLLLVPLARLLVSRVLDAVHGQGLRGRFC